MSAIIVRLLHCRPIHRSCPNTFHHYSTSTAPDSSDHHRQTEQESEFRQTPIPPSSYLNDLKASLRRETSPQNRLPQPQPFSNPTPSQTPTPSVRLNDIRRNLTEYRSRAGSPSVSLQELYRRNQDSNSNNTVQTPSIGSISEKIRQMRPVVPNQSLLGSKSADPSVLARFKDSISPTTGPNSQLDSASFLWKKKGAENDDTVTDASNKSALIRAYEKPELGKKLQMLRPSKTKGDWCTIKELNERLAKLREFEQEESSGPLTIKQLKHTLINLKDGNGEKQKQVQRINVLKNLGETPSFMLEPPKEQLAEQYFHPDCMSSAEKLKLELKKVRDEFKMSESDCGSVRVQVAQLTTKIKHLSSVLAKKDKHSRKGLMEMVQRRKKLLKYLRRTDWDSYTLVLSKLGLRDNPDTKIKA